MSFGYWWQDIQVSAEQGEYVPRVFETSDANEANHDLGSGFRDNQFDLNTSSYTEGLLRLGGVFVLVGILASIMLPCFIVCAGKAGKARLSDRMTRYNEAHRGSALLVLGVLTLAALAAALGGLAEVDIRLTSIETRTENIASSMQTVLTLPSRAANGLIDVESAYADVKDGAEQCPYGAALGKLDSDGTIEDLTVGVKHDLFAILTSGLDDLEADVDRLADSVLITKGVRKGVVWPAIALCVLLVAGYIAVGLAARRSTMHPREHDILRRIMLPFTLVLAVLVLLTAASGVILSALSGDFCISADTHVVDILKGSNEVAPAPLLKYYVDGCTTSNSVIDTVSEAQGVAKESMEVSLDLAYRVTTGCGEIVPSVKTMSSSMREVWDMLDEAGELISCRNINGQYQSAVYDGLCDELPQGLLVLWVSCVFLVTLLLLLVVQWSWMIRQDQLADTCKPTAEHQLESGEKNKLNAGSGNGNGNGNSNIPRTVSQSPARSSPKPEVLSPKVQPSTRSPSSRKIGPTLSPRKSLKRAAQISPKPRATTSPRAVTAAPGEQEPEVRFPEPL